jgi:hypothetical protein
MLKFADTDEPAPPAVRPRGTQALVTKIQRVEPAVTKSLVTKTPVTKSPNGTKASNVTKKIGRPKSAHAMTPAERQAKRRAKVKATVANNAAAPTPQR